MTFHDRIDELAALDARWASPRAEYVVLYGRRRVGKTELILRFSEGKRTVYFEATAGTEQDHLEDVSRLLADVTGRELLAAQPLTSWQAFFAAIGEELEQGPLLVALDEFQFIAHQTPAIGSHINRFWRRHRENPNLLLILSGSDVSFFERNVMGYAATTYGRRTASLHLRPLPHAELASFFASWSREDLVRAYAVFGGVPYYLEALNAALPLADNVLQAILAPDGLLREEPRFLFSQQSSLRDENLYFSVLRAIAAGRTRRNEIAARIGRTDAAAGQILDRLIGMGLVRRTHPVTVAHPDRTRMIRFSIDDPFLRFWFTFVLPFESRLHDHAGARRHLQGVVLENLEAFVAAPAFEDICQRWLLAQTNAAAAGRWWGSVKERTPDGPRNVRREVDAVAVDHDGSVLALGSCKWTDGPLPLTEKALLRRLAPHIARGAEEPDLYFFSRSGFDARLTAEATADPKCHLVAVDELFSAGTA